MSKYKPKYKLITDIECPKGEFLSSDELDRPAWRQMNDGNHTRLIVCGFLCAVNFSNHRYSTAIWLNRTHAVGQMLCGGRFDDFDEAIEYLETKLNFLMDGQVINTEPILFNFIDRSQEDTVDTLQKMHAAVAEELGWKHLRRERDTLGSYVGNCPNVLTGVLPGQDPSIENPDLGKVPPYLSNLHYIILDARKYFITVENKSIFHAALRDTSHVKDHVIFFTEHMTAFDYCAAILMSVRENGSPKYHVLYDRKNFSLENTFYVYD